VAFVAILLFEEVAMRSPARRAVFIAIDGASMNLVEHMVEWGHMPNLARLMAQGVRRPMVGVFPTLTPPGWTALYTGSWHGTHRVMDFNIRAPGRPLTETVWGIDTGLCRSEYLWNTVERAGKTPILVKVEMSWPPTISRGIQVEGSGPGVSNYHQIAGYHLFVSGNWKPRPKGGPKDPESVDPSRHAREEEVEWVSLRPVDGSSWVNLPSSGRPCLEVKLTLKPLHHGRFNMLRGKSGTPKPLFGLVYASGGRGYDKVRVCRSCNGDDAVCELTPGGWSDWWLDSFEIDGKPLKGHVCMKLITLTPEADRFELYVPQIWPTDGYTYPPEIASELVEKAGPFLQNPGRDALGFIDDDTYFEMLEYHHQHLADITHHLASNHRWDVIFTETHAPDYANHFFLSQADEASGAPPEEFKRSRDGLMHTYSSIDRWIGRLTELADDDTVVVIASDHGGTPARFTPVEVTDVLEEAGLLVYKGSGRTKGIDLSRSRAVPVGLVHIFINLKGREPNGIVEADDYEATRREVIAALMEHRDPETGRHPFALAVTREDAEALSLWSDLVGDVVYAVRPEFDGAHGRHLPVAELGIGGQHSTFVMAGPGVRQGVALEREVRVVDVAPTLCYLLGLPMPRNVEGGVIYEALENPDLHLSALDE
jgi:predicted AlkP superfamily phosphohydrolase/phosphomutase